MSPVTPDKIRTLQRKLYCKAKAEPAFRFYVLYDKICREDILRHAYGLARANAGAPGVDGVTFAQIEEQGLEAWLTGLREELVSKTYRPDPVRRVLWLKAPIEERDGDGKRRMVGGKRNKRGTPQGGVASPLLANIYMNRFLKHWRRSGCGEAFRAYVVSYADDFVILSRGRAAEALTWTKGVNFTKDRLAKRIAAIENTIERYLKELDRADREQEVTGVPVPAAKVARLAQGIETLKAKLGRLSAIEAQMLASGETQVSLTDPDARAMTSQSHSAYTVGYNVQSAVDTEHHLIVAHEVTNVGIDKGRLGSMAGKAREALGAETINALADRGYFKSEDIAACEEAGIAAYIPRPLTSNARAEGRYDRRDFVCDAKSDTYVCPAGERLTYRMTT